MKGMNAKNERERRPTAAEIFSKETISGLESCPG
jgi:hypothetical protein